MPSKTPPRRPSPNQVGKFTGLPKAQAQVVIDKTNQAARQQVARDKANSPRYYIKAPVALLDARTKAALGVGRTELMVHPGPIKHPISGKVVERPASVLVLYEGEGFTRDPLVAQYLKEQWPELEVTTEPNNETLSEEAQYRQELEELKESLGVAEPEEVEEAALAV